jgi:predicted DNA-binding transcriptional regulator AlpA
MLSPEEAAQARGASLEREMKKLVRIPEILKRIPVGRTKLREDFINTGRLRLVRLGPRAVGAVEEEVDALVDELIAERDAALRAKPRKQREA